MVREADVAFLRHEDDRVVGCVLVTSRVNRAAKQIILRKKRTFKGLQGHEAIARSQGDQPHVGVAVRMHYHEYRQTSWIHSWASWAGSSIINIGTFKRSTIVSVTWSGASH